MLRSMITATNTMGQLQTQLDSISNNLANTDTNGYKSTTTTFSELVRQQMNNGPEESEEVGRMTEYGIRSGVGAKAISQLNFQQGSLKMTGRELDFAFTSPEHFLQVLVDGEVHYTRDGSLYLSETKNNQFMLATANGHPVLGDDNNPIIIDENNHGLTITEQGTIVSENDLQNQLGIVQLDQPQLLTKEGNNLYSLKNIGDQEIINVVTYLERNEVKVQPGALESSNVDMTKEMTDMMVTQRAYQLNAKSITIGDQMLGLINSVR
ncbi:flagellar hook-basal body protein [Bacillus carboniphilus]|uniref:Flagellar hook-basal body protein n=1 Tax=Bacillus carboniphilus TaxID=86663 RepID=A0ABY9JVE4_9BACI|nr:flagellar hook-basal body protein [Bacillus carboniphilus]WLR41615.1 flagellar hook-basal body protein [Bacillus carboniphilus]